MYISCHKSLGRRSWTCSASCVLFCRCLRTSNMGSAMAHCSGCLLLSRSAPSSHAAATLARRHCSALLTLKSHRPSKLLSTVVDLVSPSEGALSVALFNSHFTCILRHVPWAPTGTTVCVGSAARSTGSRHKCTTNKLRRHDHPCVGSIKYQVRFHLRAIVPKVVISSQFLGR